MVRLSKMVSLSLAAIAALALGACEDSPASSPESPASAVTVQSFVANENGFNVTSTLVLGEHEAVLVDAQFTNSEAKRLVAAIQATGRHLSTVYITHEHPDHQFGLAVIHSAFPDAQILAHPSVIAGIKATWKGKHDQWKSAYGADLTDTEVDPAPYDKPTLALEGHELQLLGPEMGDTANTVSIFVPDAGALITGDVSYSGVHVWLADLKAPGWDSWVQSLQRLQALKPKMVVSGHRDPSGTDDPADLAATIKYIQDFKAVVAASHSADEVIKAMTAKYPTLKLPIILDFSAKAAFGE